MNNVQQYISYIMKYVNVTRYQQRLNLMTRHHHHSAKSPGLPRPREEASTVPLEGEKPAVLVRSSKGRPPLGISEAP